MESPRERVEARGPYRRAHAELTNYLEQQQQASAPAAPAAPTATRRVSFSSHVAIHTRRSIDQSDLPPAAATEEDVRYAEHTPEEEYRNRRNLRQFQRRAVGQYQPGRWTLDDGTSSFWNTSDPWEGMPPPGRPPPQKPLPPLPPQAAAATAVAATAGPSTAPSSNPAPPTQTTGTTGPSNAPSTPPPVPAKDGASDEDDEDESEGESEDDEDEDEEGDEDEDEEDLPEHLRIDPDLAHLTYEEMQERIAFLRGRLEELGEDPNSPSQ